MLAIIIAVGSGLIGRGRVYCSFPYSQVLIIGVNSLSRRVLVLAGGSTLCILLILMVLICKVGGNKGESLEGGMETLLGVLLWWASTCVLALASSCLYMVIT